MFLLHFLVSVTLLCHVLCHHGYIDLLTSPKRQLFLSRRVVTETSEFDGCVLVNENGTIDVFTRKNVNVLLSDRFEKYEVIDGGDLVLVAGLIDRHVHVNEPGNTNWKGYVTATQAAASRGITTIIDMPLNSIPTTTSLENLKIKAAKAKDEVYVDVGFWGGVVPGNEGELADMVNAGVIGFKCFLIDSGLPEFPCVSADDLPEIFAALNGTGIVPAIPNKKPINQESVLRDFGIILIINEHGVNTAEHVITRFF